MVNARFNPTYRTTDWNRPPAQPLLDQHLSQEEIEKLKDSETWETFPTSKKSDKRAREKAAEKVNADPMGRPTFSTTARTVAIDWRVCDYIML